MWSVRNRLNYPKGGGTVRDDILARVAWGNYLEFGGGHNLQGFIPRDQPRFFPTIDGKKPEKLNIWKHQICLTQPDLVEVYVANVLKYLQEKAPDGIDCININIEDDWGVCECDDCLASLHLADGTTVELKDPTFRSTQFFLFLNQVAGKLQEVHPNLQVGTYAYFFTAAAPKIKPADNIRVYFCPYVRKDQRTPLFSPINDHWWRQLTAWAAMTNDVVIREYYGIMAGFRPLAEVVAADVTAYDELGVAQFTSELNPVELVYWSDDRLRGAGDEWDLMAMEYWVISRLYWNPRADVEQLRKYYLRRTFREAAPAMERFFGAIRSAWYQERLPSDFESPVKLMGRLVLRGELEAQFRSNLSEAAEAVKHPTSTLLVDAIRQRFETWIEWAKEPASQEAAMARKNERHLQYG